MNILKWLLNKPGRISSTPSTRTYLVFKTSQVGTQTYGVVRTDAHLHEDDPLVALYFCKDWTLASVLCHLLDSGVHISNIELDIPIEEQQQIQD